MIQNVIVILFVVTGMYFMLVGSVGVLRLPDYYTRAHAVSTSDTLGIMFVIVGLIIFEGFSINSAKLAFIALFIMLSNPIDSHALGRAAFNQRVKPYLNGSEINSSEIKKEELS